MYCMESTKKSTEVKRVYDLISQKIFSGEFTPGFRLIEKDLAAAYGVSRTPVRLAIERLVSDGLAHHVPNKGAVVRQLSINDVIGLLSIRAVNEGLAARLASKNVKKKDIAALNGLLDDMERTLADNNLSRYYSLSHEIHHYIIAMADNEYLCDIISKIYSITYRYHIDVLCQPGRISDSCSEHRQIINAIVAGDGDDAEAYMKNHIVKIAHFFRDEHNISALRSFAALNW